MATPQRSRNSQEGSERPGDGERRDRRNGRGNDCDNRRSNDKNEYIERVITINHVFRVVKGRRHFSFTAPVVVNNDKGAVGVGYREAKGVPQTISRSVEETKKNFIHIPMIRRIITHLVEGRAATGAVPLRPATPGTGVIADDPVHTILEAVGVHDVLTESLRSTNVISIVHATVDTLRQLEQPGAVAARRGLSLEHVASTSMPRARAEDETERRVATEQAEAERASAGVNE